MELIQNTLYFPVRIILCVDTFILKLRKANSKQQHANGLLHTPNN